MSAMMYFKPTLCSIVVSLYVMLSSISLKASFKNDTISSYIPRSFSVNLSSRGYGAEVGFKLKEKPSLGLRIGLNYLAFQKAQNIKMDKGTSVDIFPDIKTLALSSFADYYPFKKKIFRLSGGLSYEIIQQYQVAFSSASGLNLGGLQIASDDFGNIKFGMKWNALRPYLGFGFGRSIMKNRLGFGFDMGFAYMGSPKLKLIYEGFLETTTIDDEMKKIEANMKGYSYYPYIGFQVRYNTYPIKK
ncbi:hypothetical protein GCM10027035_41030 [Emticicia sediminis]